MRKKSRTGIFFVLIMVISVVIGGVTTLVAFPFTKHVLWIRSFIDPFVLVLATGIATVIFRKLGWAQERRAEVHFRRLHDPPDGFLPYESRIPRGFYLGMAVMTLSFGVFLSWSLVKYSLSIVYDVLGVCITAFITFGFVKSVWDWLHNGEVLIRIDSQGITGRHKDWRQKQVPWVNVSEIVITTAYSATDIPTRRCVVKDLRGDSVLSMTLNGRDEDGYQILTERLSSFMEMEERASFPLEAKSNKILPASRSGRSQE